MSRSAPPAVHVCGHCEIAPRMVEPAAAHRRCRSERCACAQEGHAPEPGGPVREAQALCCGSTMESCERSDRPPT